MDSNAGCSTNDSLFISLFSHLLLIYLVFFNSCPKSHDSLVNDLSFLFRKKSDFMFNKGSKETLSVIMTDTSDEI